jgi:hypothetical protein
MTRAHSEEDQASSQHAQIFHKLNYLQRISKVGVKDNRRWNQKENEKECAQAGIITQDHSETPQQFKDDGPKKKEVSIGNAKSGHILGRHIEFANLSNAGIKKNQNQKNPTDQTGKGFPPLHASPLIL